MSLARWQLLKPVLKLLLHLRFVLLELLVLFYICVIVSFQCSYCSQLYVEFPLACHRMIERFKTVICVFMISTDPVLQVTSTENMSCIVIQLAKTVMHGNNWLQFAFVLLHWMNSILSMILQ